MTLRPARVALALLATIALALGPVAAAHAADGDVTWTVRTASNSLGAERTSYSYAVNPGATVDDALVVSNHGTEPLDLGVYAADGYTTQSGEFDLVVGGKKSTEIGAWVRSSASDITVAPGASQEVPFTLTVPKNASPGDYAGGIVTSLVQPNAAKGINVDRRLGIRITLRVGGVLTPALTVEKPHVEYSGGFNPFVGGTATLSYTLHNTGNSTISARQSATAAGPFGLFAATAGKVDTIPRLLPGESWKVTVPFRGAAAAIWVAATVNVTPVVVDAAGSTSALNVISASAVGWAVPWAFVVLLLAVIAAVIVVPRLMRASLARRKAQEDARVEEAVARAMAEEKVGADA